MARLPAISERMRFDRLTGIYFQSAERACLQLEYKFFAIADAEDHWRRELFLLRDEGDGGVDVAGAAVAGDAHLLAKMDMRELRFGNEETHEDISRWQNGKDRRRRGYIFAIVEIDVFDATLRVCDHATLRELIVGVRERRFRLIFLALKLRDPRLGLRNGRHRLIAHRDLMRVVEREQEVAKMNALSALHLHVGYPAGLRR